MDRRQRIDGQRYHFTLNAHAKTVRLIFGLAATGIGATAIAKKLNLDGVPAFKSKEGWYQSIIKSLLCRHDVIGTFQPHRMLDGKRVPDGDAIEGYFPAAIDRSLFLKVQSMRRLAASPGRKGNSFANLFMGLCFCAHCGGRMTMKLSRVKGNEQGRYMVCANYVRGHRCAEGKRHFRYEPFERTVLDHAEEINLADNLRPADCDQALAELDEKIAVLTFRLEDILRREARLALALENNDEPLEPVIVLLRTRQAERQTLQAGLATEQQKRQRLLAKRDEPKQRAEQIARLRQAWETAADADRTYRLRAQAHAAIREIITEITFDSQDDTATVIVGNGVVAYKVAGNAIMQVFRAFPVA